MLSILVMTQVDRSVTMSEYGYVVAANATAFMQRRQFSNGDYVAEQSVSAGMWWQQMPQLVAVWRIRDVIPDPGSKIFSIPDPGSEFSIQDPGFASKILTHGFQAFGNMIRVAHPGSGSRFFTHPGSRIQGSKRHRIRNTGLWAKKSIMVITPYSGWPVCDDV
jgi:hypothetical protein